MVGLWRSQGMCGPCCGESVAVDEVFGMERGGDGQDLQDAGLQDGRRWGGGGFEESGDVRAMLRWVEWERMGREDLKDPKVGRGGGMMGVGFFEGGFIRCST